jgi:hypothetical protein
MKSTKGGANKRTVAKKPTGKQENTPTKKKTTRSKTVKATTTKKPLSTAKPKKRTNTRQTAPKAVKSTTTKRKARQTAKKTPSKQPIEAKAKKNSGGLGVNGNLTPYPPGVSGNPKGRPKKVLSRFAELGYTKSGVRDTFNALGGMTKDELKKVVNDPKSTALEIIGAKEYLQNIKKSTNGGYRSSTKSMVEMFADKATQRKIIEVDPNIKHSAKSDEELDKRIQELREQMSQNKTEIKKVVKVQAKRVVKKIKK